MFLFAKRKTLSLRGLATLAYERYGIASEKNIPPLVIAHGLFGQKKNWQSLSKALQARLGNFVYAVDLRNHGDSPHLEEHTYPSMAYDLEHFINNIVIKDGNFEKVFLMGHSMGGKAVAEYALQEANRVKKLIIVDIAPNRGILLTQSEFPRYINAMQTIDLNSSKRQISNQLSKEISDVSIRQFLMTNLISKSSGRYSWKFNIDSLEKNLEHILGFRVKEGIFLGPTLFLSGANSSYLKASDHEELKKKFPLCSFTVISDAGHWLHSEQPKMFVENVVNFIEK